MNPYELSEMEARDHFCVCCGMAISVDEALEYDDMCPDCWEQDQQEADEFWGEEE